MTEDAIKLVDSTEMWVDIYNMEKKDIQNVLKAFYYEIEHIGSTAIPDTPSKPIIDIAIKIETLKLVPRLIPPLSKLRYSYMGEYGLPGRHFFSKGNPREFHLHVVDNTTDHWERWIKFRNILKSDEKTRKEYILLKKRLAEQFAFERQKYTEAKSEFIDSIVDRY